MHPVKVNGAENVGARRRAFNFVQYIQSLNVCTYSSTQGSPEYVVLLAVSTGTYTTPYC